MWVTKFTGSFIVIICNIDLDIKKKELQKLSSFLWDQGNTKHHRELLG